MPSVPSFIVTALFGYLLGSIPFAVIIAKRHGVDILKVGSGNPGATNVKRSVGKGPGNLCFALDAVKGLLAALLPMLYFGIGGEWGAEMGVVGLVGALLGHSFSVWIRFKGGKGVATSVGGLLALCPHVIITSLLLWLAVFYWKRYVSLASLVLATSLPIASWLYGTPAIIFWISLALCILLFVRHRENIVRLYHGTENKFEKKKS
jgi:glycerol-3-phosphate acyltransferase PlsY